VAQVFISADSLSPDDQVTELAYSYGPGPTYTPVQIDSAGQQATLIPASNTRCMFQFGDAIYKLVNRQSNPFATVVCKSIDSGATWEVLDSAGSPAFETCSGYFDGSIVVCAFVNANGTGGDINLINFDLALETWSAVYGTAGAPAAAQSAAITIWKRPDDTLLVLFGSRDDFDPGGNSGIGGVVYNGAWGVPFDVGAALLGLTGWDSTQTVVTFPHSTSAMDSTGRVHCFFNTGSVQTVPVVWGNRCFYQAIELDDSLGSFLDFPGQVAPFPAFPYNRQQLTAFQGSPMGQPVVVNDAIVLPVLMRNDSTIDRFPLELANVYIGSPLAAPVWALDTAGTIDPGALVDDFIFPQEAPAAFFDGTTIYALFPAQDEDGQDFARLRLAQTTNLDNPAAGWTALTAFDLQVDAPPDFNFSGQVLTSPAVFAPGAAPPDSQSVVILLVGWKLYPISPCADAVEAVEVPKIKIAF